MTSFTFSEYGERSEMMQLVEGDCSRTKVEELPPITKVQCSIDNIKKLVPILGYIDENLFEKKYGRIAYLLRIPVQISAVKALLHFWDPSYRCFTFGDIDMTPTLEEYAQILSFPNDPYKVYFRQKIESTATSVARLLHLDQVDRYRTSNGGFKWKVIENKLKTDKEKGKLGEERYQIIAFAIFGLVLFPSEAVGIISIEAANAFLEFEETKNNPTSAILAETFMSLNHCRLHGKGAMRCCVPLLFMWIVSHLETSEKVFNNFWWFNMRPLELVLTKEWNDLDEKAWVKKYQELPQSNFRWKAPWVNGSSYLMSCGDKAWVPLIGLTGYINYSPSLVARQFGGVQYVPRTWGLAEYTGPFKEASSLDKLDAIKNDWKQPLLVYKEEHQKEFSVSPNYSIWRSSNSLVKEQGEVRDKSSMTSELKRKRVNIEGDLQEELDKLRIELGKSKNHQKFLENQLLKEDEMRASQEHQMKEKYEQIVELRKDQHKANKQLGEGKVKYDELVNKHAIMEQEFATLKRALENRKSADKETIASLKKERDQYKLKWEAEKEKSRITDLAIEEEKRLRTRYQMQAEDEREARRLAESDMKEYLDKMNAMRNRVSLIQAELESREEEAKKMQEQFEEWQGHISNLDVQLNTKVAELDIEKEELQRARKQIQQLEKMVQILEKNNESLAASNETLLQDNTLFHYKIEQTDRLIDMVARKANELRVKASRIGNSRLRYEEYLNEVSSFIKNVSNRGISFE